MKKMLVLIVVLILLGGCVSNKNYQNQQQKILQLENNLNEQSTELVVLRKEIMLSRRDTGYSAQTIDSLFAQVKAMSEFQNTNFQEISSDVAYLMEAVAEQETLREDFENMQQDTDDILAGFADRLGNLNADTSSTPAVAKDLKQLNQSAEASNKTFKEQIATLERNIEDLRTSSGTEKSGQFSGSIETLRKRMDDMEARQKEINAANKAELERLGSMLDAKPIIKESKAIISKPPTSAVKGEVAEYEAARAEYTKGNHPHSRDMLGSFMSKYPTSDYLGNASYWIGENYYAEGDFTSALREFQNVISRYPDSWKAADAQLKIGLCYWHMGNPEAGKQELNRIKTVYPKYPRMDLVDKFLNQIK
ncbi:MAG: tol-pal system protein YbgF [Candidatus Cloacimonetes bacterium HGW-Cloacimonetes-3]|jgi:tol-pal system protein YbgF|nr:MAG: tol-pal system protein YbgF [Candidatus Cloacimonetes bacterium HGW-Cloacimonetes-3]